MKSVATKVGALGFLALLGAAAACAAADDDAEGPPPEDQIKIAEPEAGSDATVDEDDLDAGADGALVDAGPCAESGLCIAPAPFDTRVTVMSISGSGPNDVWAVGSHRTILHYDGKAWETGELEADAGRTYTLRSVWANSASDVWVADGIYVRHANGWNGATNTEWSAWMGASGDTNGIPTAISGVPGRVFIGRQTTTAQVAPVVTSTGWGEAGPEARETLTAVLYGSGTAPIGVWALATTRPDEAWATRLGSDRVGRIFLEAPDSGDPDAPGTWKIEEHDTRTSKYLYGVWGNDAAVWLVGEGGTARRMKRENVASRVFEVIPTPVTTILRSVYGVATNDVWAVGDDATVIHWDGTAWSRIATPFDSSSEKPTLASVWGSGPKDVWIGGNGIMLHFQGATP